jgi:hypothetical protein
MRRFPGTGGDTAVARVHARDELLLPGDATQQVTQSRSFVRAQRRTHIVVVGACQVAHAPDRLLASDAKVQGVSAAVVLPPASFDEAEALQVVHEGHEAARMASEPHGIRLLAVPGRPGDCVQQPDLCGCQVDLGGAGREPLRRVCA